MKASTLIRELTSIVNHHGDYDVIVDIGEDCEYDPMQDFKSDWDIVDVINDSKYIWLEVR